MNLQDVPRIHVGELFVEIACHELGYELAVEMREVIPLRTNRRWEDWVRFVETWCGLQSSASTKAPRLQVYALLYKFLSGPMPLSDLRLAALHQQTLEEMGL